MNNNYNIINTRRVGNMKRIKFLFTIIALLMFCTNVYALNPDHESSFFKQNEDGETITDAKFFQKTLNGVVIKEITAEPYRILADNGASESPGGNGPMSTKGVYKIVPLATNVPTVYNSNETMVYNYYYFIDDLDDVLALLTDEQRSVVDSLKTVEDYEKIKNVINTDTLEAAYCEGKEEYIEALKKSKGITCVEDRQLAGTISNTNRYSVEKVQSDSDELQSFSLNINTFTFLEEVYTPKGYEKEIVVVPMKVYLLYSIESDGSLSLDGHSASQNGTLIKYTKGIDYSKYYDFFDKMKQEYLYGNDCGIAPVWYQDYSCNSNNGPLSGSIKPYTVTPTYMNYNNNPTIRKVQSDDCYGYSVVVDKTSTEDISSKLSIETYVNGKETLSTSRNTEVTISVVVDNEAKRPSYENVIVSKIPKGFEYVEDSASDGGVFDEESNTITWNLDYLDAQSEDILLYKLKVPKNADTTLDYKSSATITADGIDEPVKSRVVTVNLGSKDKNPKTGDIRYTMLLSTLCICGGLMLIVLNKKSIKSM